VVKVRRTNPIKIVFLAPSLFLIRAVNGAKIIYATENTPMMILVSVVVTKSPL